MTFARLLIFCTVLCYIGMLYGAIFMTYAYQDDELQRYEDFWLAGAE